MAPLRFGNFGRITFQLLCVALLAGCSVRYIEEGAPTPSVSAAASTGSRPVRLVPNPETPGTATATDADPLSEAEIADALRQPRIAEQIKTNGVPDAAETFGAPGVTYTILYYRNPPRTVVYRISPRNLLLGPFDQVADMPSVPRTAQRLGFLLPPMPPPWPVTIPSDKAGYLGTLEAPTPPPSIEPSRFASKYVPLSSRIREGIEEVRRGDSFDRASRQFARVNARAGIPGFNWTLVVFRSRANFAFTVPDGSVFVSDGVIQRLSDDELAAIFAHLIAHESYGHDRRFWDEAGIAQKTAVVIGIAVAVAAIETVAAAGYHPSPIVSYLVQGAQFPTHYPVYNRAWESQANCAAVGYLASAGIPPDRLFDAMVKLSSGPFDGTQIMHYRSSEQSAEFQNLHEAARSAADLGKMLDAGIIQNR